MVCVEKKKTAILSGDCGVSIDTLASSEVRHAPLDMVSFGSFWFMLDRNHVVYLFKLQLWVKLDCLSRRKVWRKLICFLICPYR